jgi:predicted phage terminase large subunit-like protein
MREIRPQPGPQTKFLSNTADIRIYGGSAGGGKSWSILLEALRGVSNPNFNAVFFRRTFPMIRNPGGLWDASCQIYSALGARPRESSLTWLFPGGATIVMRHLKLDSNVFDWQGSEIVYIAFDELTHFTENQFWYLLSRNRSTCGITPYIAATCNPDADSWVRSLIDWWIAEDGFPIPERSGVVRHFERQAGQLTWFDQPTEDSKSLTFIAASIYDNQALLTKDPGYLKNLKSLPLVDRERLLGGNWNVKATAGKVFRPEWLEVVDTVPQGLQKTVRYWDFAATEKKTKGDDPDFTVGLKLGLAGNVSYVLDVVRGQFSPLNVDRTVMNIASQDGRLVQIRWEQEHGGGSGIRESARLRQQLAGYDALGILPYGDKVTRAKPASSAAEFGQIKLLRGAWNQTFLNELAQFPDGDHDDQVDGLSGAYNCLHQATTTRTAGYQM